MKKVSVFLVSLVMTLLMFLPMTVMAEVKEQPSRTIHIVYDDSTSMIIDDFSRQPVDRWCQAKYAMEVFASMLGEKDSMSIYAMSDFWDTIEGRPVLTVKGSSSVADRVASVHNMLTAAGNTPFECAERAYMDLQTAGSDEKWLVILTDGVFNYADPATGFTNRTDEYIEDKLKTYVSGGDIKVIYLAMAEHAKTFKENPDAGFYFERANSGDEILTKITDISNQIFQQNKIKVESKGGYYFATDIPLSEVIVFAQGPNVVIQNLENEKSNQTINLASKVSVRYSEKATSRGEGVYQPPNLLINDKLTGIVANYGEMPAGKYKIDVSGATSVEVYYKPNVKIVTRLFDDDGQEIKEGRFVEGTYRLEFGLADPETGEILESELLGKVEYEAIVSMNGVEKEMKSGDKIVLTPGDLSISVSGTYLDYNKVSADLAYEVFPVGQPLEFQIDVPKQGWVLSTESLDAADTAQDHILVTVLVDGKVITNDMWNAMETLEVSSRKHIDYRVEKGSETGTFKIYPEIYNEDPLDTASGKIDFKVEGALEKDGELYEGKEKSSLEIKSTQSIWDKIIHMLKKYWWLLVLLVIILIIVTAFWKRKLLPKKLKATNLEYIVSLGRPPTPGSSMRYSKTKKWWHQSGCITFEGKGVRNLNATIYIDAIQNWRVKHRKGLVTKFNASQMEVKSISINGNDFEYSKEKNAWVNFTEKTPAELGNVKIGRGTVITITGKAVGQSLTATLV